MPSVICDGCKVIVSSSNSSVRVKSATDRVTAISSVTVQSIDLSTDTAVSGDVLYGKTFHSAAGLLTGSMPNRGAATGTITTVAGAYSIQEGYHDGLGTVAIDATDQALLVAENIKAGVTILGVTGNYSGGTVTTQEKTVNPSEYQQVITPDTGYDYLSKVTVTAIDVMTSQEITDAVDAGWAGGN